MEAVVAHGIGDIRLNTVPEPKQPTDTIVRLIANTVCGTNLHMVRGTFPGMKPGTILGHEGVGIVEEVGRGNCSYCRSGYSAQCDRANPNGPSAGTAFFGDPAPTGSSDGLQAEYARIPFAHHNLIRLPRAVAGQHRGGADAGQGGHARHHRRLSADRSFFPIGAAMNKNLSSKMGNCNHRTGIPRLVETVGTGMVDPTVVLTQLESLADVIEAYRQFDLRRPGSVKVELKPAG